MKSLFLLIGGALPLLALADPPTWPTSVVRSTPAAESPWHGPRAITRVYPHFPELTLDQAAQIASEIARVRVSDRRPHQPAAGLPCTRYELEVLSCWKGELGGVVSVDVVGSAQTDPVVICAAAPTFEPGEELVLFLCPHFEDGVRGVLALKQGSYRVFSFSDGRTEIHGRRSEPGETLASFEQRVREAVAVSATNQEEAR